MDDPKQFDWDMNLVGIYALSLAYESDEYLLEFALGGHSPYFRSFEVSVDDGPFQLASEGPQTSRFTVGTHRIRARIVTAGGWAGPTSEVAFRFSARPPD